MVCNATVYDGQWSCSVIASASTIQSLAAVHGIHPDRLYQYNSLSLPSSCGGLVRSHIECEVPAGFPLRVPGYPCEPVKGVWECYTVQDGDSFESISYSNFSVVRSVDALVRLNEDLMWGSGELFAGMALRIPQPFCVPRSTHECHDVKQGETLDSIALLYGTDAGTLSAMNEDVLGGYDDLRSSMELKFPRRHASPPVPCRSIPGFWECYTVQGGDTLHTISPKFNSSPVKICEVNGLVENCNLIYVGQILAIPVFSCTPKHYRWSCHTVLHTDYNGAWGYQSWAYVQNGAGQDAFNEANSHQLSALNNFGAYSLQELMFPYFNCHPTVTTRCLYKDSPSIYWEAPPRGYDYQSLQSVGLNGNIIHSPAAPGNEPIVAVASVMVVLGAEAAKITSVTLARTV